MEPLRELHTRSSDGQWFATTHWSVVLLAAQNSVPEASEALEKLCASYWYPLYAYVRRTGRNVEDAQDLTQEFFARLLEKQYLGLATPERGRFRTFLLSSLKNFLANDWKRSQRQKRGGGITLVPIDAACGENLYATEPVDPLDPEILYERRWASTLLERALQRLRQEYAATRRGPPFEGVETSV